MGNKRKLDEDLEGLTPEAKKEYRRYKARLKPMVEEIKKVPLSILVWGPSLKSNSPLAVKRREIYRALRAAGHAAYYSEKIKVDGDGKDEEGNEKLKIGGEDEEEENEKSKRDGKDEEESEEAEQQPDNRHLSLEFLEFNQARAAHLVILLVEREAIGSMGELHLFATNTALITKMYAVVPTEFEGTFSSGSVVWILDNGYGGVYWYKEIDVEKSNVFSKVILRVQARREIKYKEKIQRRPARARGAW